MSGQQKKFKNTRKMFFLCLRSKKYVKNDEILNALKNPKKVEIQVEKRPENAIIDVETKPVETPVGTTPDPKVLFPEEKEVKKEEKKPYKPMKKKW